MFIFRQNTIMPDERGVHRLTSSRTGTDPRLTWWYVELVLVLENDRPAGAHSRLFLVSWAKPTHPHVWDPDGRSEKVVEVEHSPWPQACWDIFHLTLEQFRFLGTVTPVGAVINDRALSEARGVEVRPVECPKSPG